MENFTDTLVNLALAIIMLGIGLSLKISDFKNLFRNPKAIIIGLVSQLVLLPLIAYIVTSVSNLSAEIKVGIIIIAICPVGASSNLIVHLFKGNLALSIALTIINSILIPFTVPILVKMALKIYLAKDTEISLPILDSIVHIFFNVLIPALLGITFRHYFERIALILEKPLKFILPAILGSVFAIKIFFSTGSANNGLSLNEILHITPFVLALNIGGMYAGYYLARYFKLALKFRLTVAIETGLQNTALALVVTGILLNNHEMEKPVIVYALFTFFTAILFAWYFMRKKK